jgi:hypothetical protein
LALLGTEGMNRHCTEAMTALLTGCEGRKVAGWLLARRPAAGLSCNTRWQRCLTMVAAGAGEQVDEAAAAATVEAADGIAGGE